MTHADPHAHGQAATATAPMPTLPTDQPLVDSRYVLAWFGASCFWLILAPVLGLVAAAKLDDPLLLPDIHWLQFGRMRIAHVNGVVFGFFSTAIFGFMAYAVPKLTQRPDRKSVV